MDKYKIIAGSETGSRTSSTRGKPAQQPPYGDNNPFGEINDKDDLPF